MKKLIALGALVLGMSALFSGCGSVPDHANMTGTWQYTYGNDDKVGTATLNQDGFDLSGTINSPDGQYNVKGKVMGSKFTMTATSDKDSFNASCSLTDVNAFEGRYTNDDGNSGEMEGTRL